MKIFEFTVTRDVTESCRVRVKARSIEEAHEMALADPRPMRGCGWERDDGNADKPYIPDPDDYEAVK
ncbi:MAG: hypothetical protein ACREQI_14515 [Candidatus Binataceae bacterium]